MDHSPEAELARNCGQIPSLRNITLSQLADGLKSKRFSSVNLVITYLKRIAEADHRYRSIIETNPDALAIAQQLDEERCVTGSRGDLHGVPMLIKDSLVTLDRMEATAGSYALLGAKPRQESEIVTVLRKAGVVILGKTNMAEWSGFRCTNGCSGWSARGGQATGIFFPWSKASGSSTGSAISTSLGLSFASIGVETCFSIVSPAEKSGVVGFKPTRGLLSSRGIISASGREDTVGLLTRSVCDASALLEILCFYAKEENHLASQFVRDRALPLAFDKLRLGIPYSLNKLVNPEDSQMNAFQELLTRLKALGVTIVCDIDIPEIEDYEGLSEDSKCIVLDTDMEQALTAYFSSLETNPQNIKDVQDLIDFTKNCPQEEFPQRNVERFERMKQTSKHNPLYREMLAKDEIYAEAIPKALRSHRLQGLLMPSRSVALQTFAAKSGSPAVSLPIGSFPIGTKVQIDSTGLAKVACGIPFSVYLYGDRKSDRKVLFIAEICERISRARAELRPLAPHVPNTDLADMADYGRDQ